jgi:hypothetical protein
MKIKHFAVKCCLIILTGALLPCFFHRLAWADGLSLKVSPSTFRIQAKPPADIWAPFTIENQSTQSIQLKIGYKPFNPLASQNGNVTFLQKGQALSGQDNKIFQKMQIVDDNNISHDTIDLGPKQKERLRLRITLPAHEPTDDYYFSLIFLEMQHQSPQNVSKQNKENQKSNSTLLTGIGINVLLAIGDLETPQITIGNFTTALFRESGPVPFTLTVYNDGRHFIAPHGTIQIKNMFGQTVGKVDLKSSVILAGTGRTYIGSHTDTFASNFWNLEDQNISQQIVWPEHFLLGMYTANLFLSAGDNGPLYTKTIHFFAFPVKPAFIILLSIGVILFIISRVKKKLSK